MIGFPGEIPARCLVVFQTPTNCDLFQFLKSSSVEAAATTFSL